VDALVLWREFLGELTVRVVEVPVPGLRHDQPLGGLQPERVHVGDEGDQRGEALAAANSDACLIELIVSAPALMMAITKKLFLTCIQDRFEPGRTRWAPGFHCP
jgi:hypothetical protein